MKDKYVVIGVKEKELEDSIAALSELKPIIQRQLMDINYEGKGMEDAKEFGEHFKTAITAMTILLVNMEGNNE